MELLLSFPLLILLAVIIFGFKSFTVVPQQEAYVVERLGRFHKVLNPGLNILIPFIDRIAYKHTLKEIPLDVPSQVCITRDNTQLTVDGIIYFQVTDPKLASYGSSNYIMAITQLAQTTLRSVIGRMELDKTFEERDSINAQVVFALDEAAINWGVKVLRYEIKDLTPPREILQAMQRQITAEREKRARIAESEGRMQEQINLANGDRQAAINQSEGERQAAINQSEGERQAAINRAEGEAAAERLQHGFLAGPQVHECTLAFTGRERGQRARLGRVEEARGELERGVPTPQRLDVDADRMPAREREGDALAAVAQVEVRMAGVEHVRLAVRVARDRRRRRRTGVAHQQAAGFGMRSRRQRARRQARRSLDQPQVDLVVGQHRHAAGRLEVARHDPVHARMLGRATARVKRRPPVSTIAALR